MAQAERHPRASSLVPQAFLDRLRANADLSKTNWFRVGGPAQWLFKPEDTQDLSAFLKALPPEVPVTVLGVGSNVIVRDGGIEGVVVKLGRGFAAISPSPSWGEGRGGGLPGKPSPITPTLTLPPTGGGDYIEAGAAALDQNVAHFACEHGLSGLEFLSGIPGTIGGAVRMNGGAYGSDTASVLLEAEIVGRDGAIRTLSNAELGFSYRMSSLPPDAIITKALFKTQPGDPAAIRASMLEISSSREATQPIRARTGGSTFKNPEGHKAWELIDKAGCRGLTLGGAQVSEKHCNFLINTGTATASDLEQLGEEVIKRVKAATGITLEWEIKRIGNVIPAKAGIHVYTQQPIRFTKLSTEDFPLLHRWMMTPHVAKWWAENRQWSQRDIQQKYESYVEGYKILGAIKKPIHGFLIRLGEKPIGYIQYYNAYDFPREQGYVIEGLSTNMASIDLYIGEEEWIGKNLGASVITSFLKEYVWPLYDACFVDPHMENNGAIRVYEKAGFKKVKTIKESQVFWMVMNKNMDPGLRRDDKEKL